MFNCQSILKKNNVMTLNKLLLFTVCKFFLHIKTLLIIQKILVKEIVPIYFLHRVHYKKQIL